MSRIIKPDPSISPREIFARMQGAWFEPRQGYMWQENTGVTPTTSGGQTIGKLVDLSADRVASQATAANRPTLQYNGNLPLIRHADSTDVLTATLPAINVRRNLLRYSEQFDNVLWERGQVSTTQTRITNTGTSSVYLYQSLSGINKTRCYYSIESKYVSARYAQLTICSGSSVRYAALFDLTTGQFVEQANSSTPLTNTEYSITPTSDGYYRMSVAGERYDAGWFAVFQITNTYPVTRFSSLDISNATNGVSADIRNAYFSDYSDRNLGYQKITDWTSEQYSSAGSVYFSTPSGMSALHNQSIGTTYNLPALQTDNYCTVITPARLAPPLEQRLALYMHRLAGIADADFFWQEDYGPELVTDGSFSNGTANWVAANNAVITSQAGGLRVAYGGTAFAGVDSAQFNLTVGRQYLLTYSVTEYNAGGNLYVLVSTGVAGSGIRSLTLNIPDSIGSGSAIFTAAWSYGRVNISDGAAGMGAGGYFTIDNISIREVLDGQVGQLLADGNDTILLRA